MLDFDGNPEMGAPSGSRTAKMDFLLAYFVCVVILQKGFVDRNYLQLKFRCKKKKKGDRDSGLIGSSKVLLYTRGSSYSCIHKPAQQVFVMDS